MNKWQLVLSIALSSSLMACSTTNVIPDEPIETPPVTEPDVPISPAEPELPAVDPIVIDEPVVIEEPEVAPETPVIEPSTTPVPPKPLPLKTSDGKLILGEAEWVYIPSIKETLAAKVDDSATSSLLAVTQVIKFERDGKSWVKFIVQNGDVKSKELSFPVERWSKSTQADEGKSVKRPIILSWIQVGQSKEKTELTLVDHQSMSHSLVLGLSYFRDIAVVDMNRTYVQPKPN